MPRIPDHHVSFTTRDYMDWVALSQKTRDLARRYFETYPEELAPRGGAQVGKPEAPAEPERREVTEEGVVVIDKRIRS